MELYGPLSRCFPFRHPRCPCPATPALLACPLKLPSHWCKQVLNLCHSYTISTHLVDLYTRYVSQEPIYDPLGGSLTEVLGRKFLLLYRVDIMALRNDDHSSADATVNMASEGEKNPQGSTATHEDVFANNPFFTDPAKVKTTTRRLQNLLSHLNAKDVKELFKCSVALWIITVFIVIDPILKAEGQALFFGW